MASRAGAPSAPLAARAQPDESASIGTSEPDRHIALGGLVQTTNSGSTIGNIRFAGPVVITDDTAAVQAAAPCRTAPNPPQPQAR